MLPYSSSWFTRLWIVPLISMLAMIGACGPHATSIKGNTEGYDLEHPRQIVLPTALNEISGLWYYPKDSSLFAIVDEDGFLYKIFPKHPDKIYRWKFAGAADYEDLVLFDNVFYIMQSNGTLYATSISSGDNIQSIKYPVPESGNEYESLYYDEVAGMLILVCKDCNNDKKKTLSTLGFNPVTRQYVDTPLEIYSNEIAGLLGAKSIKFKPSATTLNPFTGQLMIVSAVNGLLVIAGRNGRIQQAYPLETKLFKQPEGIAVGADRTLYISNEWNKKGTANIMVMPYKPGRINTAR